MPSADPLPVKIDYSNFLSYEATHRARSQLKQLRPYFDLPGMLSLGGGYPHPSTWPVNGMTVSVPFAEKSVFIPGYETPSPEKLLPLAPYTAPLKGTPLNPNLTSELQYGATFGAPHFVAWLKEHTQRIHNPPYSGWEVHNTAGNTDGVDGVIRTIFDRGDYCLVEEFAYPGFLTGAASQGIKCIGVPMDGEGITADALDEILSSWDEKARGGPRPKMLVLVPTCSNPTGSTMPELRKREVYAVCRKWNVLILEDDPYCFLQIRPQGAAAPIIPSFLSIDTDGRVIRVDSFSKIVAPGSRCGWITGPTEIVTKIMNRSEGSTQCPSGFAIAAISAVLNAWGGHEGFEKKYLPHISSVYEKRCLSMVALFEKYLPKEICEWPAGSGGMFLWVRVKVAAHPECETLSPEQISDRIFHAAIDEKVIVAPSVYFKSPGGPQWTKEEEAERIFLRLSFSLPGPEDMEEAVKRLGQAVKKEFRI